MSRSTLTVLLLGGTAEASALARLLARDRRFATTLSYAGRTSRPLPQPVPVRSGGFGGIDGLVDHIQARQIDLLVDATHPFAAQMSRHAAAAATRTGIPLLALRRPPWTPVTGDRWIEVADLPAAITALGPEPLRVFLTIGRKDLGTLPRTPAHHYLVRSVDPPDPGLLSADAKVITAMGPFALADELWLMREQAIQAVVSKNAGGSDAKLTAARMLGLPVMMIARPAVPEVPAAATAQEALAWLERHHRALLGA